MQNKKIISGVVVSNKMTGSVVVKISTRSKHPIYGKIITRGKKFMASCKNPVNIGDLVKIEETKKASKLKHWRVI